MSSPFGIRFFTRGYERTQTEMSSIHQKAARINTGFVRMGRTSAGVGPLMARGFGVLKTGISAASRVLGAFAKLTIRVTAILGVIGGAAAAVGIALTTKFAKGLMSTRETFYLIETAMVGIVKNAAQVQKISEWAMRYAAKYPAMYSDVMETMKGLAMMPSLKPIFTKASVVDMEKIMNIVQGLAALDPQQGVRGAIFAIREALSGQWRSMMMRFEIRPSAIAEAAGMSVAEMKQQPELAIKALDAFVKLNVGAETLRKSAESLGVQWGNLSDRYKIWLNTVAQYGAYRKLVEFLLKINDVWGDILKSDTIKRFGQDISRTLEGVIESLESSILGIDWTGAGIFDGMVEAGKDMIIKLKTLFLDAKDIFASAMDVVLIYMKQALLFSIKKIFWPVGVAIGEALFGGLSEVLLKKMKERFADLPNIEMSETTKKWMENVGATKEVPKRPFLRLPVPKVESKDALDKLGGAIKAFWAKQKLKLPERKEIPELFAVDEQRKTVAEAMSKLRMAELLGVKKTVDALKRQLNYEERLLGYHEKTAKWKADPMKGKREIQLAAEIKDMDMKRLVARKGGEGEELLKQREREQVKKQIELNKLTAEKEKVLAGVKKYTGAELERRGLEMAQKKNDLKAKLLEVEKQIARLLKEGGDEVAVRAELEPKLLSYRKQILALEQKFVGVKRQQLDIQKQIQMLEMMKGKPGEVGVGVLDKIKGHFQSFYEGWMRKGAVRRQYGATEVPGMEGLPWGTAAKKSREQETRGIPIFSLVREEMLRRKAGEAGQPLGVQKMLLERLYQTNVGQFQMARGRRAKGAQFLEANELMGQLQDVERQLLEEQIALTREQAENIKNTVVELKTANRWLSEISSKTGLKSSDSKGSGAGSPSPEGNTISGFMNRVNQVVWSPA